MSRRRPRYTPFTRTTNPLQSQDSARAWVRAGAAASVAGVAAAAFAVPAQAAPDTECMRAGISTLKSAGLLSSVAKNGVAISDAVALGVTVRDGADISGVPDPIPFNVLLADHRAGENSLFVYPWCG
ncbi:hypothetical protein [Phycicoccus flavus]|uniref:hypothetical protein n=1 Tax=Phycicoccus flavus TaxID=2502783 RepID=UPI000FEB75BC|nr:hypothetical protein [Phycicoccus flavus]NHA68520.1 hypothetical protein [Phycicoccus flavus]